MALRIITIRPKTTAGAIVAGTAIVLAGGALLIVGTTLLLGLAAVGATVGVATLAYRRLTGRHSSAAEVRWEGSTLEDGARRPRLGLDPRMEVLPPSKEAESPRPPTPTP